MGRSNKNSSSDSATAQLPPPVETVETADEATVTTISVSNVSPVVQQRLWLADLTELCDTGRGESPEAELLREKLDSNMKLLSPEERKEFLGNAKDDVPVPPAKPKIRTITIEIPIVDELPAAGYLAKHDFRVDTQMRGAKADALNCVFAAQMQLAAEHPQGDQLPRSVRQLSRADVVHFLAEQIAAAMVKSNA